MHECDDKSSSEHDHDALSHDHESEAPLQSDHQAPHDHHFCVGSHLFYLTAQGVALDLSLQLSVLAVICQPQELWADNPAQSIASAFLVPDDPPTSRELRAHLCVYSI